MSLRELNRIALITALIAVLARLSIPLPFSPVPVTGQLIGIFLAGLLLGGRNGFLAVLAYLLLGAAGAPVFSYGLGGPAVLFGPSGGYLWVSFPAFSSAASCWKIKICRALPAAPQRCSPVPAAPTCRHSAAGFGDGLQRRRGFTRRRPSLFPRRPGQDRFRRHRRGPAQKRWRRASCFRPHPANNAGRKAQYLQPGLLLPGQQCSAEGAGDPRFRRHSDRQLQLLLQRLHNGAVLGHAARHHHSPGEAHP